MRVEFEFHRYVDNFRVVLAPMILQDKQDAEYRAGRLQEIFPKEEWKMIAFTTSMEILLRTDYKEEMEMKRSIKFKK